MKVVPFLCLFLLASITSASLVFADQDSPKKKGEVSQKSPPEKAKHHKKKKKKKLISNDDYDDEEDTCILEFPIEIPEELFDSARQVSQQQLI